ncbi:hypothetical protein LUZ60_013476 [Juncus effusus]|nr:hypothetical protein LUZ60_013476 [Juncus effusus]
MKFRIVNKVLLFSDPVEDPDNCIVVALVSAVCTIAYCRIKDKKWKEIDDSPCFSDIIKHNNVLYGVTFLPDLFAIDLTGDVKVTLVACFCRFPRPCTECYLMDSFGKLLLLLKFSRVSDDRYSLITYKFEIFELKEVLSFSDYDHDIEEDEWEHVDGIRYQWFEVKSIGNQVVFIGYNQTVWFDSHRYLGCKANRIYFADCDIEIDAQRVTSWFRNKSYSRDVGIYHIDDDRIEPFPGFSTCPHAQTVWLSPIIQ